MKPSALTPDQRKRLQTLYAQACARSLDFSAERAARVAWAAELVKRPVASFNDLTKAEAGHLIDALQAFLGIQAGAAERKGIPFAQARRAGLDGRHDGSEFKAQPQLARAEDIDKIDRLRLALGWTAADLERFLYSKRSPLRKSKQRQIVTTAHAKSVYWALKAIVKAHGATEQAGGHAA